jgi:hypothetical protein
VTAFDGGAFHSGAFDAAAAVVIPGVGPAGAATFVLDLEAGSQLTFSWRTEVQKALNGLEQRICDGDAPAIATTAPRSCSTARSARCGPR